MFYTHLSRFLKFDNAYHLSLGKLINIFYWLDITHRNMDNIDSVSKVHNLNWKVVM